MADEPGSSEIPWRRDPEELAPGLAAWAAHAIGPGATVADLSPPGGNGMSSETVLFSVTRDGGPAERFAARVAPLPSLYPVFPDYDLELQRRCMDLVAAHTDVPVPRVRWCELDPSWLGAPFLVMERVDGVPPSDIPPYVFGGWVMDLSDEERSRLARAAVSILARVHSIDAAHHDLSFLARPEHGTTPLEQQLGYQRWYYEWAREGVTYSLIEQALDRLEATMPRSDEAVLTWGDARIGNVLWQGLEPAAVLDWEMATVGPPEVDLAWMCFLHRFFQDLAERYDMPGIPGFMDRAEMAGVYEAMTGRTVGDLDWYELFAALRFAIVSVRTSTRGIAYGTMERPDDPHDLIMFRSIFESMLDGG